MTQSGARLRAPDFVARCLATSAPITLRCVRLVGPGITPRESVPSHPALEGGAASAPPASVGCPPSTARQALRPKRPSPLSFNESAVTHAEVVGLIGSVRSIATAP
jgi:hypothetical protein